MKIKRKYFFKYEYEILAQKKLARVAEKERTSAANKELEIFERQFKPINRDVLFLTQKRTHKSTNIKRVLKNRKR